MVGSTTADSDAVDPWAINRLAHASRALADRRAAPLKLQIERELERRGFGTLRTDLVRLALSDNASGRVQLVHDLLDMPGVGAKAWLMLLADDTDADVRLAAVTVMATSSDAGADREGVASRAARPRSADRRPGRPASRPTRQRKRR